MAKDNDMKMNCMNHVDRFNAVMNFQPIDRLPQVEWAVWWDKTIERWKKEGLPSSLSDTFSISKYMGLDPYIQFWFNPISPDIANLFDNVHGAVCSMDDYVLFKDKIFTDQSIFLESMRPWAKKQLNGDVVVWITLEGFFWYPRKLMGIERHMYGFYDLPELMHTINSDLTRYYISILEKLSKICRPTFMTFAEDMSYNHGPMLSKSLFNEFISPYYKQLLPLLRELGTVPIVDTDGKVNDMIQWFESIGINGVLPLERQAGVDAIELRKKHPKLRMIGHFDKLVMTHGEPAMRVEFERLLPAMKIGGFIPSVDHQTPPDVSFSQYQIYLKLLSEYTRML